MTSGMSGETVEEMRSELEATGAYRFYQVGNEFFVSLPELWHVYGRDKLPSLIQKAYAHYQREKQFEAMRGLLEEIAKEADEYSLWLFGRYPETVSSGSDLDIEISIATIHKVKALLESMKTEVK